MQYFGVNRKSFNNIGIRENPIDVSTVEESQLAAEDVPWTEELHLTVKEQNILFGKSWLNGSIINAAMVRKACCWSEVVGLEAHMVGITVFPAQIVDKVSSKS